MSLLAGFPEKTINKSSKDGVSYIDNTTPCYDVCVFDWHIKQDILHQTAST